MNIIEAWGTGIPKIFEAAKIRGLKEPVIEELGSSFRFTLYRTQSKPKGVEKSNQKSVEKSNQKNNQKSNQKSNQKILELIKASPSITISELADKAGLSESGVKKNLRLLKNENVIERIGADKGGYWKVISEN